MPRCADCAELVRVLRQFMKQGNGHSAFCISSNQTSTDRILPSRCLCPQRDRQMLEVLEKHGVVRR